MVGAGINGLCTAFQFLQLGLRRVALLEQFQLGHNRGSSHGQTRITRSSYHAPHYIELVTRAHREFWPQLEERVGEKLLIPTPGCFFGPAVPKYVESLRQVPQMLPLIEVLEPERAREVFPSFRFPDSPLVVHDKSAAVVRAERTRSALGGLLLESGVTVLEGCQVEGWDLEGPRVRLRTTRGPLEADRVVVTAGPWIDRLVPATAASVRPARQHVGYFEFPVDPALCQPGQFPVWVYTRRADEEYYGLPEYGRPGVKVARHRTGPHGDDPDAPIVAMTDDARADLEEFIRTQFAWPLTRECGAEQCYYTNTPQEDFILDLHPDDPRLVIGAGFSGHGFKFGPLTGRILAELALYGGSSIEEFERHRARFALARQPHW